jgi:hypothetical protein
VTRPTDAMAARPRYVTSLCRSRSRRKEPSGGRRSRQGSWERGASRTWTRTAVLPTGEPPHRRQQVFPYHETLPHLDIGPCNLPSDQLAVAIEEQAYDYGDVLPVRKLRTADPFGRSASPGGTQPTSELSWPADLMWR